MSSNEVHNFEKEELKQLLTFPAYEVVLIFDREYVVAMGSPLVLALANAFLYYFWKIWLSECPVELWPNVHKRYADGIFVTFDSYIHLLKFVDYMNH